MLSLQFSLIGYNNFYLVSLILTNREGEVLINFDTAVCNDYQKNPKTKQKNPQFLPISVRVIKYTTFSSSFND